MMNRLERTLAELDVPARRVHAERFAY